MLLELEVALKLLELESGDPNIFALSEIRDMYIKRGTLRLCIWMCDAALALQFI